MRKKISGGSTCGTSTAGYRKPTTSTSASHEKVGKKRENPSDGTRPTKVNHDADDQWTKDRHGKLKDVREEKQQQKPLLYEWEI